MRQKQEQAKNLGLGVKFIVIVIVLILISASFKIFDTIRSSVFDGKSNFYILKNTDQGLEDIVISPSTNSVILLGYKSSDNSISASALPYNLLSKNTSLIDEDNFKSQFLLTVRSSSPNPIDLIRLALASFQTSDIKKIEIDSSDPNSLKEISQAISDPKILDENLTVEISNATGVSGVGNVLAKMVSYMGANVILVSTSDKIEEKSKLVSLDKNSLTVGALRKMFNLNLDNSKPSVSDVKIIIGKDLLERI